MDSWLINLFHSLDYEITILLNMRDIPWCTRITNLRLEFWNSTPSLAFVINLNGGTFFKPGFRDFKFIYQT